MFKMSVEHVDSIIGRIVVTGESSGSSRPGDVLKDDDGAEYTIMGLVTDNSLIGTNRRSLVFDGSKYKVDDFVDKTLTGA